MVERRRRSVAAAFRVPPAYNPMTGKYAPLGPVSDDDVQYRWGKVDGDILAGSSGTVSLWRTTGGGWEGWDEDSTINQEDVYAPPTLTTGLLEATKWVLIAKINGRWVVVMYQC